MRCLFAPSLATRLPARYIYPLPWNTTSTLDAAASAQCNYDYVDHARNHCCVTGLRAYNPHVRISKVDPSWATVFLQAKDKAGENVGGAEFVFRRKPMGWTVFDGPGTGGLGCGVPEAVQAELELTAPPHCKR